MKAGLILIGDEILRGETLDKNLAFFSKYCQTRGVSLIKASLVADCPLAISGELASFFSLELDFLVCSGGLGPTPDDRTKESIGNFLSLPMEASDEAREVVLGNYLRREKLWNEENAYHVIPKGMSALANLSGFAPGLYYKKEACHFFSLPGVPSEFRAMVEEHLFSKASILPNQKPKTITIRTKEIAEENIFNKLCPTLWKDLSQFGKVSSLPRALSVDIVIQLPSEISLADFMMQEIALKELVYNTKLSKYIWHWGEKDLPLLIVERARQFKKTFAFAESCTGGLLAAKITDIAGASEVFKGSAVVYDLNAKKDLIGVGSRTLKKFGAISPECALEMARGARRKYKSDIALATSGLAGPGISEGHAIGTIAIGIASKEREISDIFSLYSSTSKNTPSREEMKERFTKKGLFLLLDEINRLPSFSGA